MKVIILRKLKNITISILGIIELQYPWIRGKGKVVTACLPIVKYYGAEHMEQLADDFKAWGIHIFNPHTYLLDDGGRPQFIAKILEAKHANDPKLLLNPGKLITS